MLKDQSEWIDGQVSARILVCEVRAQPEVVDGALVKRYRQHQVLEVSSPLARLVTFF